MTVTQRSSNLKETFVIFFLHCVVRKLSPVKLNSLQMARLRPGFRGHPHLWRLAVLSHCSVCVCFLEETLVISK